MTDNGSCRGDRNSPLDEEERLSADTKMSQNDFNTTNISSSSKEVDLSTRMIILQQEETKMSQNNYDTTNISSSSKEVELSTRMIFMMDRLIQQQDCLVQQQQKIIGLIEAIAPKKEESDNNDFALHGLREWAYASAEERLSEHETIKRLKLYGASQNGDWEMAKTIYDESGNDFGVEITRHGDTALHIATAAKRINFVKELTKKMNKDDLTRKNKFGRTALFVAAMSGTVKIAEEIMIRRKEMAMVKDIYGTLPIQKAATLDHKDMVKYLYQKTKHILEEEDRNELFVTAIEIDCYDVAWQMLRSYPDLATARAKNEETALHVLARKDIGPKYVDKKKLQALALVELIWKRVRLLSHTEISELIAKPRKLIFDAAKRGNSMFLSILIRNYPDMIWKFDNPINNYSIFHYAVKDRREYVFKLIDEIGSHREIFFETKDKDNNNILHLAAMLAPSDRLNIVPGAALQMQRELLWFKEVKKFAPPRYIEARNIEGLTPKELFTKEHEALRDNGEKWMKETAGSCMVVATLITGVAFAAAITIPGGNNQDTGFPVFLEKISLRIFAISDAISLVSSSASILNFLSVFTSRFAEEDFLWWLLRKLRFGLLTLFISIVAMMVVFSTTFFIFFHDRRLWIAILVTVIASVPIMVLFRQHTQLFYDVYSTYVSDPLFHQRKTSLFEK